MCPYFGGKFTKEKQKFTRVAFLTPKHITNIFKSGLQLNEIYLLGKADIKSKSLLTTNL